ncbi:hypothetical protein [Cytophaga aurantiaca]|nr:hypothetical protein [Cytophaga aurantiaca]
MKKIVFTIALLALLTAVSYASNNKQQSAGKTHNHVHHTHIVVPVDHYNM